VSDASINLKLVLEQFQDFLAPRLDTYEQALYLYCFRHSRLVNKEEVVIGFKSARKRMATGIGEAGKPMSEGSCYKKLQSLAAKGCIDLVDSTHDGTKLRVHLPSEIVGVVPPDDSESATPLDEMDFFEVVQNREAVLRREGSLCFYCLRQLDPSNWLVEHVRSRPEGDNSYRNVVAACRTCNNRKGSMPASDFLRDLYRTGVLSQSEFEVRLAQLGLLENGELKPVF
jgi:hypothetical protein